jgi:hypothetical protein
MQKKTWKVTYDEQAYTDKGAVLLKETKEVEADHWILNGCGITFKRMIDNVFVNVFWIALKDVRSIELKK